MNRSSTSPYRGGVTNPRLNNVVGGNPDNLERMIRELERENNSLAEELNVLRPKVKRCNDL
jgi:hypothetical protein